MNKDMYFSPEAYQGYEIAMGLDNNIKIDLLVGAEEITWDTRFVLALGLKAFVLGTDEVYSFEGVPYSGYLDFGQGETCEATNLELGEAKFAYILLDGNYKYEFGCKLGGKYSVLINGDNFSVSIKEKNSGNEVYVSGGNRKYTADLQEGKVYLISIIKLSKSIVDRPQVEILFMPDELIYGENEVNLESEKDTYYSLPSAEKISILRSSSNDYRVKIRNKKMEEMPVFKNGNEWIYSNDSNEHTVVEFINDTSLPVKTEIILERGEDLVFNKDTKLNIDTTKYYYFTPEISGYYKVESQSSHITANANGNTDVTQGDFYLNAGEKSVISVSTDEPTDTNFKIVYSTQTIKPYADDEAENWVVARKNKQFIRFVSPIDYTFNIILPNADFCGLICDGEFTEISGSTYAKNFEKGKEYIFVIDVNGTGDTKVFVNYSFTEMDTSEVSNVTLNEQGELLLRYFINEGGFYGIESDFNCTLLNSAFEPVKIDDVARLGRGYYFILLEGDKGASGNIGFELTGQTKKVGQQVLVTQNSIYNYDLVIGNNYNLISTGNKFDKTKKTFEIYDANGQLLASGEGVTTIPFTATTERIIVKVTLEVKGRSISMKISEVARVEKSNLSYFDVKDTGFEKFVAPSVLVNSGTKGIRLYSGLQQIDIDPNDIIELVEGEMTGIIVPQDTQTAYVKMPEGSYYLFVEKQSIDSLLVQQYDGSNLIDLVPVNGETTDNDTFYKYQIDLTKEEAEQTIFLVQADTNLDVTLLKQDLGLSIEFVTESGEITDRLIQGNNYTIQLVDGDGNVLDLGDSRPKFAVYADGELVSKVNGYYNFDNYEEQTDIFVEVDFYDYTNIDGRNYVVEKPAVKYEFRSELQTISEIEEYVFVCEIKLELTIEEDYYSSCDLTLTVNGEDATKYIIADHRKEGQILLNSRRLVDIDIKYDGSNLGTYKKVDKGDFVISLRSFQGGIEYSDYVGIVSPAYTVVRSKQKIVAGYYKAYFKTEDFIKRLNIGTYGIRDGKQVSFDDFGDMVLHYPPVNEQQKIAEILAGQDRIIALKEKLLAEKQKQKKYLMQQLLTGKKRLPGFSGEWKKVKLGKCLDEVDLRTTVNNEYDILSVTKDGIVRQTEHFNRQIASTNNIGYKIIKKNQVAFSVLNLWMGSVDVLQNAQIGIISPAYKVFNCVIENLLADFAKYFLRSYEVIWLYNINSETGASVVRKNLDIQSLFNCDIVLPSLNEQTAIAEILSTADKEIELLKKDIEQEKLKKKSLMQLLLTGIVRVDELVS